jgi:hypothetical protein
LLDGSLAPATVTLSQAPAPFHIGWLQSIKSPWRGIFVITCVNLEGFGRLT